ncbi:MAG: hypothetical protein ACK6CP_01535 [Pseudanabaena sp.]|jgi:hypothetical protein|nr:hypothetical protein [Pseudanabaena sp. M051S1SP2A07QC]MCA6527463.1 hypothetical protein [Pseudanabaena sp. M179S2SP2A07QC]MCA6531177.1 hypothetical protein [Pseudanabaena sp. M125S2SP2A07QC]MCA6535970.1 hypothetical protein [Pseudanabaena sp. M176S2SP2A07QC]MCA6539964.1 hypothetical protein [Pseudanabaena sp. M037S2SP2A07QC]MCA6542466.1 hypothetical protein [Pseudanabaena sp. M074S1SP2A07QC]MCA6549864.1 hypothetical protein [Pseudanabaena sp. M152S2SP2A07QC]MCA6551600.1 hypothetical prot
METITINVDSEVAKAYREAQVNKQQQLSTMIKLFFQPDLANKTLSQVMAEIADKAEKRGLTPEILQSILEDDDE